MHAIVLTGVIPSEHWESVHRLQKEVMTELKKLEGFKHALVGYDRDAGTFMTMSIWSKFDRERKLDEELSPALRRKLEAAGAEWASGEAVAPSDVSVEVFQLVSSTL